MLTAANNLEFEKAALLRHFGDATREHLPLVAWPPADARAATPARRVLEARHRELFGLVPGAEHGEQAPGCRVVEHRDLLGDPDRVVQRQDRRADHEPRVRRPREDRRADRQRGRHPAVVDAVVLGEHERVEAVRVGPRELFERGRVDLLRRLGRERVFRS